MGMILGEQLGLPLALEGVDHCDVCPQLRVVCRSAIAQGFVGWRRGLLWECLEEMGHATSGSRLWLWAWEGCWWSGISNGGSASL